MYGRVAHCAGLVFLRLVMERRSRGGRSIHRERVTFETNQIYVAALQQARVRRTMRRVARHAALGLDGSVLPGKWTCLVCMAVETNHVLGGGGTQLLRQKTAVLVVAIGAVDQALIHAMVERLGEIRLDFQMAAVTQGRLRRLQKLAIDLGRVHRMAVHAPNVVFQVLGAEKVGVLFSELMAAQAALGGFFARERGKPDDLFRIGRLCVRLARPMAGFTALPFRTVALVQRGLPVRPLVVTFGLFFVAGFAGLSAHVLGRVNGLLALRFLALLLATILGIGAATLVVPMLFGRRAARRNHPQYKEQ